MGVTWEVTSHDGDGIGVGETDDVTDPPRATDVLWLKGKGIADVTVPRPET